MKGYIDKRCPCLNCFVQRNCTEYCELFHIYRKLVLAETDFFIKTCDPTYKFTVEGKERYVTDIQRDIEISFKRSGKSKRLEDKYLEAKHNMEYLSSRFSIINENSRMADRGNYKKLGYKRTGQGYIKC